jgi:hypothetical protein
MSNHRARTWDHRGSKPLGLKLLSLGHHQMIRRFFTLYFVDHRSLIYLFFYFSLFRRFCNHLYLQALTAWRNQQNHESLATVALLERKIKMHTLSYCPFRNDIRNFRDHHSSKRSINLIDPIYILILSSKHAKTSSNEEKKKV